LATCQRNVFVGRLGRLRQVACDARWGVGERLRVAGPTGAATVLLGGSTVHNLLGLQRVKSAVNNDEDDGEQVAQDRTRVAVDARHRRGVDGAAVDAGPINICAPLALATNAMPFVGVAVVATSDFSQLKPIVNKSLESTLPSPGRV
jgi:hypothetical protein